MHLHLLLCASQLLACFVLLRRKLYTVLPWFTLSVILAIPLTYGYQPTSTDWISAVYLRLDPAVVVCRLLAAVGSIALPLPRRVRYPALTGIVPAAAGFVLLLWLTSGRPALSFVVARRYVQVLSALISLFGLAVLWRLSPRVLRWQWSSFLYRHAAIFSLILLNHATVSAWSLHLTRWSALGWYSHQARSFVLAAALYAAWSLSALAACIPAVEMEIVRKRVDLRF